MLPKVVLSHNITYSSVGQVLKGIKKRPFYCCCCPVHTRLCYPSSIFGKVSIAAFLSSASALTYTSTYLSPLCPNIFAVVSMFAPCLSIAVAKEWRAQCHVICFSMPALLVQCLSALRHIVEEGSLNISSASGLSVCGFPTIANNSPVKGFVTLLLLECPLVL